MTTARSLYKFIPVLPLILVYACSSTPKPAAEPAPAPVAVIPEEIIVLEAAPPPPPPSATVSLQAAMQGLVSNPSRFSYQYSGWVEAAQNTVTGSGTLDYSASVPTVLGDKTATKQTTQTRGNLNMKGGARDINTDVTSYHDPATFASLVDESTGVYAVYSPYQYPNALKAGDKGQLTRAMLYRDQTKAEQLGYFEVSYSVEGNPEGPLVVNLITDRYDNARSLLQTGSISFLTAPDGSIQPIKGRSVGYPVAGQAPYEIFNTYVTGK